MQLFTCMDFLYNQFVHIVDQGLQRNMYHIQVYVSHSLSMLSLKLFYVALNKHLRTYHVSIIMSPKRHTVMATLYIIIAAK